MIDNKYIELMNREIDNQITPEEKAKLDSFLAVSREAREYYDDLIFTSNSLDEIPEPLPPSNLKQRIINLIDFSKYSTRPGHNKKFRFGRILSYKYTWTFAAGILAGLIIYSLVSLNSGSVSLNDISGTMGAKNIPITIESIPVNLPDIKSSLTLKDHGDDYWLDLISNSSEPVDYIISYSSQLHFENIKPGKSGELQLSSGQNYIKITSSGSRQCTLRFTADDFSASSVHFKVLRAGNILYERELTLNR